MEGSGPKRHPVQQDSPPAGSGGFGIVALAASAGGLAALSQVLSDLPADFPVPIVVVQHLDPRHRSLMAEILDHRTQLTVREAADGLQLTSGTVFIAPPDRHMLVNEDSTLSLTRTELVHFVRPSADLLFESVAASYRERAIAVVLTGAGSDGSLGAKAINSTGGTLIVQDEGTSAFFGMPGATIREASVDFILPLEEIGHALRTLLADGVADLRLRRVEGES